MRYSSSSRSARRAAWAAFLGALWVVAHTAPAAAPNEGGIRLQQPGQQAERIDPDQTSSESGGVSGTDVAPQTRPDTQSQPKIPAQREGASGAQQQAPSALQQGTQKRKPDTPGGGELEERLPEAQYRRLETKSLTPEITGVTPRRGSPGTRVRIRGRHLEPGGDRGPHKISLRRVGPGFGGSAKAMEVRSWTDTQIVAVIPDDAYIGPSKIMVLYPAGGGFRAKSVDFEVVAALEVPGGGDPLGDAGRPDTGSTGGTGFVATPEAREPLVVRYRGIVDGQLAYGHVVEVEAEFYNSGDRAAYFMPAYQFGGETPQAGRSSPVNIPAKVTKAVTMRFDLRAATLPGAVQQQIVGRTALMRIFAAKPTGPRGSTIDDWRYGDSPAHYEHPLIERSFELEIELLGLTRHARCRDWAEGRDWEFYVFFRGTEGEVGRAKIDARPDDRTGGERGLGPIRWRLPIEAGAEEVGFRAQLRALKDGGGYKNRGHYAQFDWKEWFDPYHPRGTASPRLWTATPGSVERELRTAALRSTEPHKAFCGSGNLELRARLTAHMVPYRE